MISSRKDNSLDDNKSVYSKQLSLKFQYFVYDILSKFQTIEYHDSNNKRTRTIQGRK